MKRKKWQIGGWAWVVGMMLWLMPTAVFGQPATAQLTIQPGDTWAALSYRFAADIQAANPHMNKQRQPTIGTAVSLPPNSQERNG
ncbi:MAG: hypothetical protein WBO48_01960, partial [Candidatus Promineifilaceae bacterium]